MRVNENLRRAAAAATNRLLFVLLMFASLNLARKAREMRGNTKKIKRLIVLGTVKAT